MSSRPRRPREYIRSAVVMRGHTAEDLEPRALDMPTYPDPDEGGYERCCHTCGHPLPDVGMGCQCVFIPYGPAVRFAFTQRKKR